MEEDRAKNNTRVNPDGVDWEGKGLENQKPGVRAGQEGTEVAWDLMRRSPPLSKARTDAGASPTERGRGPFPGLGADRRTMNAIGGKLTGTSLTCFKC